MPQLPEDQRASFPLPVYNYRVTVDGETMSFAKVSGIEVSYDTVSYRHGFSFLEGERIQSFAFDSFSDVTLTRGVILGARPLALYQWLEKKEIRGVEVSLCDETGTPVVTWKIAQALPVKVAAPEFDADSNNAAIESLTLKARGISIVVPEAGIIPSE